MKQIIIFCFLFASLALAQRQSVVVLNSLTLDKESESKITPNQLVSLTNEVRKIVLKELPQDKFNLWQQDKVTEALKDDEAKTKEYADDCAEGKCVGVFIDKLEVNFGTRCDIYTVQEQLRLKCELYGKRKGESEAGTIDEFSNEPIKDIQAAIAMVWKKFPAMLGLITKSPQELCMATKGNIWMDGVCTSQEKMAQDACSQRSSEGYVWADGGCKSKEQLICEATKGNKWEGNECKSQEQQNCEKQAGKMWQNGACKSAVAMPPAPVPVPSAVVPPTGGGGTYSAQIVTEPAGASLNVNGAPYSGCTRTPCYISLYERSVRLSAVLDDYDATDTTLSITTPNQVVKIKLRPKGYAVSFYSEPSGASLNLEGEADARDFECQTPCVWYFKKGNVKVSAWRDKYHERKDTTIFVSRDAQINLKLNPNYGTLNVNPAYSDGIGKNENWDLTIDGNYFSLGEIKLLPGSHNGKLSHRCYEDIRIDNLRIEKNGRVNFDVQGKLALKQGGVVLKAERYYSSVFGFSKQVSVPFSVNGKAAGETTFNGTVPLCSEIEINSERIDAKLESGSTAEYTYKMRSYMPTIISGIVGTALFAFGLYQNSEMENVYKKEYANMEVKNALNEEQLKGEYDKAWDKVESARTIRNLAYILGGASFALGVVLWF